MNLNKVMAAGNLTRDPEVRYTPKGTAVTDIGMAINRSYATEGGERKEETTFIDVTFWGKQAEVIGQYLVKGKPIYVEGRMQLDTWDDKNTGEKRSKLKVVGENFQFIGKKDDDGDTRVNTGRTPEPQAQREVKAAVLGDEGADSEIPF